MSRLVSFKIASFFVLSLLITLPLVSSAENLKIINVYSIGDKAAFLVVNTSNNQLMELAYKDGRFTRMRPLNFSLRTYSPVHWNGEYWLLQKGLGPVVELYIYNGSLKHVKTFVNGTICAYNDLRIWWNGEEYLLTFLKSSPNDNPATGECYYPTDMYLLLNDKLIPLNVSGTMTWVPPIKEWFATGVDWFEGDKMEKIALINETGGVVFLNVTLQGLYGSEIAYNGSTAWLVLDWAEGNLTHIEVYLLGRNVARRVHHEDANGSIGIPIATWGNWPQKLAWNGNPILIQSTGILNDTVLIFNGTGFSRVGTFNDCSELTPVSVDGRVFILCMMAGGERRVTMMKLFAIKGGKKELVRTFRTSGYPYRYGVKDFLGFPAFKENNHSSLILYTSDTIMLFNSTHAMNLLTGERTPLPAGLRGRNYNVTYCSGEWLLFTKSEVYTLKDGKFAELKLTISSAGEATNGTTSSPVNTQTGENTIPLSKRALTLIITGVAAVLLLLALHRRRR
ncbi:hypothetical protein [Thermococcus sp. 21S7]|uniref:hypothetical protein n=1 Tax=Thermococcus sp. 21S7 TaxID=1638221 RepID=UPI00143A11B7|nr:hypothetical protein [Thermococcus sp. 21S7]NJE61733.1 hypothetical protein [Thermococcus sp. 21S7]